MSHIPVDENKRKTATCKYCGQSTTYVSYKVCRSCWEVIEVMGMVEKDVLTKIMEDLS